MSVFTYEPSTSFHNAFGPHAQVCKLVESDELVIGKKDFSVSFWMKTRFCGLGGRPRTFFSLETMLVHYNRMDSDKDFGFEDVPLLGGVLLSNKDCTKFGSDGFAISILPYQAYFHVNFCTSSKGGFLKPVDDDWHFLVINFDRDGLCSVVCDTHCIGSFDISKHKDVLFKEGRLGIGADVKGNWGFQNGNLEHIEFATRLLGKEEIDALYYPEAIKKLCNEILDRIPLCSRYAPKGMIDDIKLLVTQSALEKPNKAQFEQLRFALEEMIGSGSPKAVFGMISDIHILKTKPTAASMLRHAIKDLGTLHPAIDALIVGGDISHDSSAEAIDYAWTIMNESLKKAKIQKLSVAVGNHELWMGNHGCYATGMPAFQRNIVRYRDDGVTSPVYYCNHMMGYSFLVLNCETPLDNRYTRHQTHLTATQLSWLKERMDEEYQRKHFVFVMLHQPFENTFPLTDRGSGDWDVGEQDKELRTLLGHYDNFLYLCGHMHQPFNVAPVFMVDGKFPELQIPGLDFTPKNFCIPGSGYVMVIHENLILLRARDFTTGRWLTPFDKAIHLTDNWKVKDVCNTLSGEERLW